MLSLLIQIRFGCSGSSKTRFRHDISHQRLLDDKIVLTGAEQTTIGGTQLFIKNSVLEATKIYGWHFLIFRLTININQDHLFLFCQCIKVNNSTKLETHLKLHYTILAASINQIQKLF